MEKNKLIVIMLAHPLAVVIITFLLQPESALGWLGFALVITLVSIFSFYIFLKAFFQGSIWRMSDKGSNIFDFSFRFPENRIFSSVSQVLIHLNRKLGAADELMMSIRNSVARLKPMSEGVRDGNIQFEQSSIINQKRNHNVFSGIKEIRNSNEVVSEDIQSAFDSIIEERKLVGDSKKVIDEAVTSIRLLVENVKRAEEKIGQLKDAGEQINDIIEVISSIADQTNLLALNAAIEAARAGDSGRGFAVVADEVRQLAHRTHDSTLEVREKVEQIQVLTKDSYQSMHEGASFSENAVDQTTQTNDYLSQISEALDRISEIAAHMKDSSEREREATLTVVSSVEELVDFNEMALRNSRESTLSADDMINLSNVIMEKLEQFEVSDRNLDIKMRTKSRAETELQSPHSVELF